MGIDYKAGEIIKQMQKGKDIPTFDEAKSVLISVGYLTKDKETLSFYDSERRRKLIASKHYDDDLKATTYIVQEGRKEVFCYVIYDDGELVEVDHSPGGWHNTLYLWERMVRDGEILKIGNNV